MQGSPAFLLRQPVSDYSLKISDLQLKNKYIEHFVNERYI